MPTGRKGEEMKKLLTAIVVSAALFAVVVGGASANGNPNGSGQRLPIVVVENPDQVFHIHPCSSIQV